MVTGRPAALFPSGHVGVPLARLGGATAGGGAPGLGTTGAGALAGTPDLDRGPTDQTQVSAAGMAGGRRPAEQPVLEAVHREQHKPQHGQQQNSNRDHKARTSRAMTLRRVPATASVIGPTV
ncbi:hypothetical protein GCM10010448_30970 [Streptomyces glomeratus]|uniref:Uncharacterized protein n=1 Tax=Streptomyces glomeratus TaxID=284452 RepID=A0ABP6LJ50_9ACTN